MAEARHKIIVNMDQHYNYYESDPAQQATLQLEWEQYCNDEKPPMGDEDVLHLKFL